MSSVSEIDSQIAELQSQIEKLRKIKSFLPEEIERGKEELQGLFTNDIKMCDWPPIIAYTRTVKCADLNDYRPEFKCLFEFTLAPDSQWAIEYQVDGGHEGSIEPSFYYQGEYLQAPVPLFLEPLANIEPDMGALIYLVGL